MRTTGTCHRKCTISSNEQPKSCSSTNKTEKYHSWVLLGNSNSVLLEFKARFLKILNCKCKTIIGKESVFGSFITFSDILSFRNNYRKSIRADKNMKQMLRSKTAFTRCRHILKTMKNVTVAKFELAFTRCRNNLKTVGNLPVKSSLHDFDAKEVCLSPKNRSVSFQKRMFHHF